MKKTLTLCFLVLLVNSYSAQDWISQDAYDLAETSYLYQGRLAFWAKDGYNQKAELNEKKSVIPASTQKLLTTYAALDILGPGHRFITRIGHTGEVHENGTLLGDVIIEGGGDPALASSRFSSSYDMSEGLSSKIVAALKKAGVSKIRGIVKVDESYYEGPDIPDEWTWQDMGNYYACGIHAFTYNENRVELRFASSKEIGSLTSIEQVRPSLDEVEIVNHVKAAEIRNDQAYVYAAPRSGTMDIYGRIPIGKTDFEVVAAHPHPALGFEQELHLRMKESGIVVEGKEMLLDEERNEEGRLVFNELFSLASPTLLELVKYTNMKSNNLYAEHFLRQIGRKKKGHGNFWKGIEALEEWCDEKVIDTEGWRIKDGSGLSHSNLVTAKGMVDLLEQLKTEEYFEEFVRALPVAGVSGSMRRIGKGTSIEGRMYAKTGYLEGVRAYAGFLEKPNGEWITFMVCANDYSCSASKMREELNDLMISLGK